jgi:glycosyltransferase involved in cell wall biosynthesis
MKLAIVTDTWKPELNGVVRFLSEIVDLLRFQGHEVLVVEPGMFMSIPLPPYPDLRISMVLPHQIAKILDDFVPDAIHIATESSLGWAARRYCIDNKYPFTTMIHTRLPEYIRIYLQSIIGDRKFTEKWGYALLKKFHRPAARTFVSTKSAKREFGKRGFRSLVLCPAGYNHEFFYPRQRKKLRGRGPIYMYMGRIAKEKNLEAFLSLQLRGTKYVVGDGPEARSLKDKYPKVVFTGSKQGDDLAEHLSSADVFVFPSKTETLGLVMIEALACGTPVAAFPAPGAKDMIKNGKNGYMDQSLEKAIGKALKIPRGHCPKSVRHFSWQNCVKAFIKYQSIIKRTKNKRNTTLRYNK